MSSVQLAMEGLLRKYPWLKRIPPFLCIGDDGDLHTMFVEVVSREVDEDFLAVEDITGGSKRVAVTEKGRGKWFRRVLHELDQKGAGGNELSAEESLAVLGDEVIKNIVAFVVVRPTRNGAGDRLLALEFRPIGDFDLKGHIARRIDEALRECQQ